MGGGFGGNNGDNEGPSVVSLLDVIKMLCLLPSGEQHIF